MRVLLVEDQLPLVRALQILYSTALLGGGHQRAVARLQVGTAALNVVANLPLIAVFGWKGAVIATYVSEVVNLGGLATMAGRRRHDRSVTGLWSPADPVPSG